jgi:hypothetical protein
MGFYINKTSQGVPLPIRGKADALIADGAKEIAPPVTIGPDIVVVVENHGAWDAALHCNNEHDFARVVFSKKRGDDRPVRWLSYEHAEEVVDKE